MKCIQIGGKHTKYRKEGKQRRREKEKEEEVESGGKKRRDVRKGAATWEVK